MYVSIPVHPWLCHWHIAVEAAIAGLMIMASHQTFPRQIKHSMSGQFGQTNFICIINGNFIEFAKENECLDNFYSLS